VLASALNAQLGIFAGFCALNVGLKEVLSVPV
jgi:hypothetical protein